MAGRVHKHKYDKKQTLATGIVSGHGIIIGDDAHHYFFMPSLMRDPYEFPILTIGSRVAFYPTNTVRGWRATGISVEKIAEPEKPDAAPDQRAI